MQALIALISGILFGLGLSISALVNPQKVLNFLNVSGPWDPSLLLTMGSAIIVTMITSRIVLKKTKPLMAESFKLSTKTFIDKRLICGAMIFGIGWGLVGLCPGPSIAALIYYSHEVELFIVSMLIGMLSLKLLNKKI